jgi:hypothetical protein
MSTIVAIVLISYYIAFLHLDLCGQFIQSIFASKQDGYFEVGEYGLFAIALHPFIGSGE